MRRSGRPALIWNWRRQARSALRMRILLDLGLTDE
jgi:hypothetical protein